MSAQTDDAQAELQRARTELAAVEAERAEKRLELVQSLLAVRRLSEECDVLNALYERRRHFERLLLAESNAGVDNDDELQAANESSHLCFANLNAMIAEFDAIHARTNPIRDAYRALLQREAELQETVIYFQMGMRPPPAQME